LKVVNGCPDLDLTTPKIQVSNIQINRTTKIRIIIRSGGIPFNADEMIFIRDIHGTGDPKDDLTHSWAVSK
jgi:hypothetical protein